MPEAMRAWVCMRAELGCAGALLESWRRRWGDKDGMRGAPECFVLSLQKCIPCTGYLAVSASHGHARSARESNAG